MPIFALLLVLEIGVASLLVNVPNKSHLVTTKKVLGEARLLADDTPSVDAPSENSNPSSAPEPTPAPATETPVVPSPAPEPPTTPAPETNSMPPTPEPTPAPTPQENNSTPAPVETPASEPVSTPAAAESPASPSGILMVDETTVNPDKVDSQSVTEAKKEDEQLEAVQNPVDKAEVLTHFASDKINDIDRFTQEKDFNSTTFANIRLSTQIEQLRALPTAQQKLSDVCQQATTILRAAEETVPEEMEQDLEITRSKCL